MTAGAALVLCACAPAAIAPERFSIPPLALHGAPRVAHPDRSPSWMVHSDSGQTLLYVSDAGAGDVFVYTYPGGKKVGTLSGLSDPTGVCNGASGAIWIVESSASKLVKYLHRGTKPVATLTVVGAQRLTGCAVDPGSGNLAVADLGGAAATGGLWVFTKAQGTPKEYQGAQIAAAYFCGYDASGNLFVDGLDKTYDFDLAEVPAGGSKLQALQLDTAIEFPGGVRWDGQYVAVGDQAYQNGHTSAIYQLSVTGLNATVKGTTILNGSCDVLGFSIKSGTVAAPDACQNNARFFAYPAGGAPTKTLMGFQYPVAAAVSVAR